MAYSPSSSSALPRLAGMVRDGTDGVPRVIDNCCCLGCIQRVLSQPYPICFQFNVCQCRVADDCVFIMGTFHIRMDSKIQDFQAD